MINSKARYRGIRTFNISDWQLDLERVHSLKGKTTISVCIPCQNEEKTIGSLVREIKTHLMDDHKIVDEILVINDRSQDQTAEVAEKHGARVIHVDDIHPDLGPGHGKGNALWGSVAASHGEIIVWCDGDLENFTYEWIIKLLIPLLIEPELSFVKGFYHRPMDFSNGKGGGRTTELAARPLISLFYPELSPLYQPLAGEVAVRRSVIEQVEFVQGWGVDVGLLVDVMRLYGAASITQVDLGVRHHHHRPLEELSIQAAEIGLTLMMRSTDLVLQDIEPVFRRPEGEVVELNIRSRPSIHKIKGKK